MKPIKKPQQDWHKADIIAVVHKSGTNLRQLALAAGYCESACRVALIRPWPAVERIIAARIGKPPEAIWPSRYHPNGKPKRPSKGSRWTGPVHAKNREAA